MPLSLFVYGSLRAASSHPMALKLRSRARLVGRGLAPGTLYDFHTHPGAIFESASKRRIEGDVFALPAGTHLLDELDRYEGLHQEIPPFRRIEIEVRLNIGQRLRVWSYALSAPPANARLVESGNWMVHLRKQRGSRAFRP